MKLRLIVPVFLSGFVAISCNSQIKDAATDEPAKSSHIKSKKYEAEYALSLADILIRIPGVFVDERGGLTTVKIRGGSPLFVVDGVPIGNTYSSAAGLVNVHDVDHVEVLKSLAETAIYGIPGRNGVIIIKTKRGI